MNESSSLEHPEVSLNSEMYRTTTLTCELTRLLMCINLCVTLCVQVILMGLDSAGKSTLLAKLLTGQVRLLSTGSDCNVGYKLSGRE